mmetsp:Transcript_12535/g.31504  ORF Transcript_12535/g.31504 Transcript_12535/m.31504 type:complete len:247 (+) Transcript_12535:1717-2457(+)
MALEELFKGLVVEVDKLFQVEKVVAAQPGLCLQVAQPREHHPRPHAALLRVRVLHLLAPLLARVPQLGERVPHPRDLAVRLLGHNVDLLVEELEPVDLLERLPVHDNLGRCPVGLVGVVAHGERGDGAEGVAPARHHRQLLEEGGQRLVVRELRPPLGLAHALLRKVSLKLIVQVLRLLLLGYLAHGDALLLLLLLGRLQVLLLLLLLRLRLSLRLALALRSPFLLILHLGREGEGRREGIPNVRG